MLIIGNLKLINMDAFSELIYMFDRPLAKESNYSGVFFVVLVVVLMFWVFYL